jgi:sugar lactone lactonase YvrE
LLVTDSGRHAVHRLEDGRWTTIIGTGSLRGIADVDAPALQAVLPSPYALAVGADGAVVIGTSRYKVYKMTAQGVLTWVAGTGVPGFSGDGGPARLADLGFVAAVAIDLDGRIVLADIGNSRIRRIDEDGTITTVAGTGTSGFSGDGGPATSAQISGAQGLVCDPQGRIVFADQGNHRVRRIELDGTITTIAGTGTAGFSGDGGPATSATLKIPGGLAVANDNVLFVSEVARVRRIDAAGTITTVAGTGVGTYDGDGGPALSAGIGSSGSLALAPDGALFYGLRRIGPDGIVTTIGKPPVAATMGTFTTGSLALTTALLPFLDDTLLAMGTHGVVLHVDEARDRIDRVVGYGVLYPDGGSAGFATPSLQGQAQWAPPLGDPRGIAYDPTTQTLALTERSPAGLRFVDVDTNGDNVVDAPAAWTIVSSSTTLTAPGGIAHDPVAGGFVVVDETGACVRRVGATGTLGATLAGVCGAPGSTLGALQDPTHVVVSPASGAVYVSDTGNHRVLRVHGGVTALVLGNGVVQNATDGAPARSRPLSNPRQLVLDDEGNLFIAATNAVRVVVNGDGDDDADGDDTVDRVFPRGQTTFEGRNSHCLHALARQDDGALVVADACQGFAVRLRYFADP